MTPFAVISGVAFLMEILGLSDDPTGIPLDWGFGGLFYVFGLPLWIGYLWAAGENRDPAHLKVLWTASIGLNTLWALLFILTLMNPDHMGLDPRFWAWFALFPAALLPLSIAGYRASPRNH